MGGSVGSARQRVKAVSLTFLTFLIFPTVRSRRCLFFPPFFISLQGRQHLSCSYLRSGDRKEESAIRVPLLKNRRREQEFRAKSTYAPEINRAKEK